MQRWVFFGRVLPERLPLRINPPIETSNVVEQLGISFDLSLGIADGQFVANVTLTNGSSDLLTLRNLVENNVRSIVDLIGYQEGMRFEVETISGVSLDSGERCIFGTKIPILAERRKARQSSELPANLLVAVSSEVSMQMVLSDFREAIRSPIGTGFFCYRAIEAMMQSMKNGNESDSTSWARLRNNLCVARVAIDYVKRHADLPRHGKVSVIADNERAKVFEITDEIIGRFIEYLMNEKHPLPGNKFPELII